MSKEEARLISEVGQYAKQQTAAGQAVRKVVKP